jgi:hypothetical protein
MRFTFFIFNPYLKAGWNMRPDPDQPCTMRPRARTGARFPEHSAKPVLFQQELLLAYSPPRLHNPPSRCHRCKSPPWGDSPVHLSAGSSRVNSVYETARILRATAGLD